MALIPTLKRIRYMFRTCQLRDCNRQAVYFSEDGKWKLCTRHMGLIAQGHAAAITENEKRKPSEFDLDALGELDENGELIQPAGNDEAGGSSGS